MKKFTIKEIESITGLKNEIIKKHISSDKVNIKDFFEIPSINHLLKENWDNFISVDTKINVGELFAGTGGLAIGLEKANFNTIFLNEFNKNACDTLKLNRPDWNLLSGDIKNIDFSEYKNKIDILSGGFPCQAFSYSGKRLGLEDTRGTLFYEFSRVIKETSPKIFMAENVKGLLTHENGKTINLIKQVFEDLGYHIIIKVLNSMFYNVAQKRERIFIIGIKKELIAKNYNIDINIPCFYKLPVMNDILFKSYLYPEELIQINIPKYPKRKEEIMSLVPEGGYWKDLPLDIQKEYMKKSFFSGGGKTGIARRLSLDEPCLTLTCSPAQKQTERCHPIENRPLSIREYARIQSFPDDWIFKGSKSSIYQQIGNAVPVNLGFIMGKYLSNLFKNLNL